jgi:hypothetical protein
MLRRSGCGVTRVGMFAYPRWPVVAEQGGHFLHVPGNHPYTGCKGARNVPTRPLPWPALASRQPGVYGPAHAYQGPARPPGTLADGGAAQVNTQFVSAFDLLLHPAAPSATRARLAGITPA